MKTKQLIQKIYNAATVLALTLLLLCFFNRAESQTVNKKLYLKSGTGMSRVVPTSATIQSTTGLFKQSAVLGVNGNFKSANGGSTAGTLSSLAFAPSGTNTLLLVSVSSVSTASNVVSAVTFGGVALTKLTEATSSGYKIEFWYLKSPAATSGSVTITWPAGNNLEAAVGYSCLSNVDQTNTFSTPATASGTATASSLNVNSQAGDIIVDAIALKDNSYAAGTGQTELFSAGTNSVDIRSSWKAAATGSATQTNMAWTGLGAAWNTVSVGVKGLTNNAVFTQSPVMCSNFTVTANQTITIVANAAVTANAASGTTIPFTAKLSYGSTTVFSSGTATNTGLGATGSTGTLTWTGTIPSDVVIPAGQALALTFSSDYAAADIRIDYDATSKISYVDLPTSTYINVNSVSVYNAAYNAGSVITQQAIGVTDYTRAVVSDPFGSSDITALDFKINTGSPLPATSVATAGCTRTYEYAWTPTIAGSYTIQATAKEGTEGTVTHSATGSFTVVRPSVSVAVTKTSPAGAIIVGSNVTYNIAVSNTGLSAITTLPLQDIFSAASLQYVSASLTPTSTASGLISWTNILSGSLAAGATTNITVTFKVLSNSNPLNNTARVEGVKDNFNYSAAAATNTLALTVANTPDAIIDYYNISAITDLDVLLNDVDADVSGSLSANSSSYTVAIEVGSSPGSVSVNPDKTIKFTPGAMTEDQLVSFKYRVTETATGLWDTATVFVRYSTVNNAPSGVNDVVSTISDEPITVNVLANDADTDGTLQMPSITVAPKYGTAVVNADKTITYTPYTGFTGTDVLTYKICDNGTPVPPLCSTATLTVSVVNTVVVCQEASNTFTVSSVTGALSYIWTIPAGATVTSTYTGSLPNPVTTSTSITINFNGVTPGFYNLCAKPTNVCGNGTDQCINVYVGKVQLSTSLTNVACRSSKTGAVDLTVTGGRSPYTYTWTGPSFSAAVEDITALAAGTYNVTVNDKYGCTASTSATLTQPATSVSVTGTVTSENPYGSYNGAIDITPANGTPPYTYSWSTGAVTEDISNIGGGTYAVTVSDAGGCPATKSFTVTSVGSPLTISSLTKTDVKCNGGNTGTADLEVIGGTGTYTYAWTGPSSFTATTQDLSSLAAGTYNVTVSDGSTTVTGSVTITQPSVALSASRVVANVLCNGASNGSITVTVSGGTSPFTYLWNTGATTKDLTNLSAGPYSVIVTDNNGCTTTASATVTQPSAISVAAVVTNSNCATGNSGSIVITPSGGTTPYTYAWSNGATTKDVTSIVPGAYSVVVTDAAGCSLGKSFTVANSCIGIAKTISSTPVNNGNGSYTLTYNIKVENKGTVALSNIQVTDNLTTTFTGATSFIVNSISSASFTTNGSFNGSTNTDLLAAPLGGLLVGEAKYISLTVTVVPGTKLGIYNNTASVVGTDPNGLTVTDNSQNGSNVDPDSDGNPTNNSAPTPASFTENPIIAIAKKVTAGPTNNYDGSYNVTYSITVKNVGNVPLKNVQLADNLATTFSGAPLTVTSLTSSLLTVNNAYNGSTNTNLLGGTDVMAINDSRTIVVSIRVSPTSLSTYNNTAIGTAQGPGGTPTTDNSNDGVNPDPDNDGDPTNNNIPTPVTFTEAPVIGLAERVVGAPVNLGDGRYRVAYSFILKNMGNVPIKNIQLTDAMGTGTFAGKSLTVDSIVTTGGLTPNNLYNGAANSNLLSGTDVLALGGTATVTLYVKVTPGTNLGVYNNNGTASAKGPLGTVTSDLSNNGTDVDPENDGPGNNSIPTPVSFTENPQIGVAKTATNPVNNHDGTYSVTYNIKVTNTGNVPLNNVQVQDNLNKTFTGAIGYTVTGTSGSGSLTANSSFNGSANLNLFTTPNSLAVGASATAAVQLIITAGKKLGVYDNTAFASGTSSGGTVVYDTSTNGLSVDPDIDGDPGNNDTITPVQFMENAKIGVAKRVSSTITNNGNGTYTFSYEILVKNVGDVPLNSLQVADDLKAAFPAPASFSVNAISVAQQPASSTLVTNGSFNGSTNTFLLNGSGSLAVNEVTKCKITLTVNPGAIGGPYYNSAVGFAMSPGGMEVIDNSQDGINIDPDNDGDPTNDNDPTPVIFFEGPKIGLAKRVVSVKDSTNGMNTVTFELKIKNYGNVELQNLAIYDNIVTQFASVTPANFTASQGSLFINPTWNGTAASNILAAEQNLAVGDSGNVFISFTVIPRKDTVMYNTAVAKGYTLTNKVVTDSSTNGIKPDFNNDGDPGNDSIPTPVPFILHIPLAIKDSFITKINTPITRNASVNDRLSADGGNTWSLIGVNGGALHGSVTMNSSGVFTYTPANAYVGTDLFYYRICDADGDCDTTTVKITINPLKDSDKDGVPDENDIDDDNDGITDYVEVCGPGATSWSCTPGGSDPSKDDDNDGVPNYQDADWGILNSKGCVAALDADGDGVPNYLDFDSDNDGIADVIEALGADANGDGIIDNYTDTDNDGLSQNVDASNTGEAGSGYGLGAPDFDGDGIPNYLDLDADNDGIPDVVEAFGADVNNDGRADNFVDADNDGWNDAYDGDANSDGTIENFANVLLYSNPDTNGDGKADTYPYRANSDNNGLPNFIDLDSDGDGLTDATESGITAASYNKSMTTGCTLVNGWCNLITALPSLNLTNSDGIGKADVYDIDSDNDGITDNIEGQPTNSYIVPSATDSDNDGIADSYDIFNGVGGNGITPYDHDNDGTPDYIDLDTDNDGSVDIFEGDKSNINLTQGIINSSGDSDFDGLMDIFDTYNLATSDQSAAFRNISMNRMGAAGSFNGPSPAGSTVSLVRSVSTAPDRDWRNVGLLPLTLVHFSGSLMASAAKLTWDVQNEVAVRQYNVMRSTDGVKYEQIEIVSAVNAGAHTYNVIDELANVNTEKVYYQLEQVEKNGEIHLSNVITLKLPVRDTKIVFYPNPVKNQLAIQVPTLKEQSTAITITDIRGRVVYVAKKSLAGGSNTIILNEVARFTAGAYFIRVETSETIQTEKLVKE